MAHDYPRLTSGSTSYNGLPRKEAGEAREDVKIERDGRDVLLGWRSTGNY